MPASRGGASIRRRGLPPRRGSTPQTHAAGAAGAGDVDLDPGDAALGAIQVVQVLEQSIDVRWVRARCPGTRRARAHENRSGSNNKARRREGIISGSQVGQDHLSHCKTDAFTRGAPLDGLRRRRCCSSCGRCSRTRRIPHHHGILRRPSEPSDIAFRAAAFVQADRKGTQEAAHDLLSMRRGVRLHSVEVSMNVLNRRWLFRVGVGLLGALLAIQLVPYGRDHSNPP